MYRCTLCFRWNTTIIQVHHMDQKSFQKYFWLGYWPLRWGFVFSLVDDLECFRASSRGCVKNQNSDGVFICYTWRWLFDLLNLFDWLNEARDASNGWHKKLFPVSVFHPLPFTPTPMSFPRSPSAHCLLLTFAHSYIPTLSSSSSPLSHAVALVLSPGHTATVHRWPVHDNPASRLHAATGRQTPLWLPWQRHQTTQHPRPRSHSHMEEQQVCCRGQLINYTP